MTHPDVFLYHADCRDALRALPDNCIDSVVTDPPYHLTSVVKRFGGANAAPAQFGTDGLYTRQSRGFMNKEWDGGDIAFQPALWSEVLRVLKPGGHVVAFGASRGYHRMACAIEDAGFEIRDSLMWVYATGFPKSMNVGLAIDKAERGVPQGGVDPTSPNHGKFKSGCSDENESGRGFGAGPGQFMAEAGAKIERELCEAAQPWSGFGTALKPAFEPIVLARKPLSEPTVAANVLRWRTGALNIDATRIPGWKPQVTQGINSNATSFNVAKERQISGDSNEGRWPANVVHDGSDEVVGAFPTTTSVGHDPRKSKGNPFGGVNDKERDERHWNDESKSAARFFYSAKASAKDRAGSKHPTVKPVALMQWLARLVTPPGGVILDPFAGSGTTGAAALAEGFKVVLCEREDEYVADIRRRLSIQSQEVA